VRRATLAAAVLTALPVAAAETATPPRAVPSCLACHSDADVFDEAGRRPVTDFAQDVHAEAGLSCHDCHGGNPDPALRGDMEAAKDARFKGGPFRGKPARKDVPALCGRCHSDPAYMRRFNPSARVDQEREYRTSQHGKALARGDAAVATCIDCHGVHGIRRAADTASSVYPSRVADTCRTCHSDAARMAGRKLADGRPLPVDQFARWRGSVHARAMDDRGDLSAPTCNDCHGNHGAIPPGVDSIAMVCGQCHGREAELFRASRKRAGFEEHQGLLKDAGPEGCGPCHENLAGAAGAGVHLSECVSCHGNHGVTRPTVALLAPLPDTPCAFCHEGPGDLAAQAPEPEASRQRYVAMRDSLLDEARAAGIEGAARFDWLVDGALELPTHTLATGGEGAGAGLRPEFERLFTKFRIGRHVETHVEPGSGAQVQETVRGCSGCHEAGTAEPGAGARTAAELLARMREVTALTARAERILLAARRGGVETRQALLDLDHAVDAQIELEVLVHSFSTEDGSAFARKHQEGLAFAQKALASGAQALAELGARRRGLAVAAGLIALVLVALALKIRSMPDGPVETAPPA
jgi:hypothetical protein